MKLSVSQTAKLFSVSVRTLHYYDQIGLLKPSEISESGYRYYDEKALELLEQIIFYRELQFSLRDISDIMSHPDYDKRQALEHHRALLVLKRQQLDALIALVDNTIKGDIHMDEEKITIADIEAAQDKYAAEAAERWGKTEAWAESKRRHSAYSSQTELAIAVDAEEIMKAFAACIDSDPSGREAQALVARWKAHITKYHYPCTDEILSGLGQMYVADKRFAENMDRYGDGNAQFISDAIAFYIKPNEKEL